MLEKDRKRVYVSYFKESGEHYRTVEEFTVGKYSEREIIERVLANLRYTRMDVVVMDGNDGVRPYLRPYLLKYDKKTRKSKGF